MPLLKLWNSIRGRSTQEEAMESRPAVPAKATEPARRPTGRVLFGGGPNASLCKLVRSIPASSVLEIAVEDGSRALDVLKTLAKTQQDVRYFAIDQFELTPGGVPLKRFHRTLRAEGVRPQLYPGSIDRGLVRIAHTVGTVDLIIVAAPLELWQAPTTVKLIERVSHPETALIYQENDTWRRAEKSAASHRRAA